MAPFDTSHTSSDSSASTVTMAYLVPFSKKARKEPVLVCLN